MWLYNEPSKVAYLNEIALAASTAWGDRPQLTGPLMVEYTFFLERPDGKNELEPHFYHPGPDYDNLSKSVQDGISMAGVWKNDYLIFQAMECKLFCEETLWPRIEVTIYPFIYIPKNIILKITPKNETSTLLPGIE